MSMELPEGYKNISHIMDVVGERVVSVAFNETDEHEQDFCISCRAQILSKPYLNEFDEWHFDAKIMGRYMNRPEAASVVDARMRQVDELLEGDNLDVEEVRLAGLELLTPNSTRLPIDEYYGSLALRSILNPGSGTVFTIS